VNHSESASRTSGDQFPVTLLSIHGNEIAYRRAGEGPVLLLLHGIAGSSETWVPAMKLLQRGHTVLAPDFLGHGDSSKPPGDYSLGNFAAGIRDCLDVLQIHRATVVGHSYGGGVAMQFAYQFPERCERLVLVDAGGLGREVSWLLRIATLPGAEYVLPAIFWAPIRHCGDTIISFLRDCGIRSTRAAEMWRSFGSLTDPANRAAFVRTIRAVIEPGGQAVSALDRLYLAEGMPTLIVWGDRDRVIPLSHAHQAHEVIPNSRLEIMEGAGHFPHVDKPFRFVEILEEFLRTSGSSSFRSDVRRNDLLNRTRSQ
jgi:pimeloyl-ACP methyl ester carboxylesterase